MRIERIERIAADAPCIAISARRIVTMRAYVARRMVMTMTHDTTPLAVTVPQACRLTGYGPTTIWALLRDGRLRAVRVPGIRRTLVSYETLRDLLSPACASAPPPSCPRGRPHKLPQPEAGG